MQIVIDIPEDIYEHWRTMKSIISEYHNYKEYMSKVHAAIADGIVLPKAHGDLIDRNTLECDTEYDSYTDGYIAYSKSQIMSAPVIIEADKAGEENVND